MVGDRWYGDGYFCLGNISCRRTSPRLTRWNPRSSREERQVFEPRPVPHRCSVSENRSLSDETAFANPYMSENQLPVLDRMAKKRRVLVYGSIVAYRDQVKIVNVLRLEMFFNASAPTEKSVDQG